MSAWPNAAFDLVGMCCGHFQMDFWTFFGATVLGKAFTLRPIQARVANFFFPSFFPLVLFFFFLSWNTSHTFYSLTPYPLTGLHLAPCRRPRHACASLRPHSVDANPSPPAPVRAPPKFASSSPPTHPPHPPIRPHSPTRSLTLRVFCRPPSLSASSPRSSAPRSSPVFFDLILAGFLDGPCAMGPHTHTQPYPPRQIKVGKI